MFDFMSVHIEVILDPPTPTHPPKKKKKSALAYPQDYEQPI